MLFYAKKSLFPQKKEIKMNHDFCLTILGSNSAKPAYDRHPSAQLLKVRQEYFLIDCGEGTQMQLDKYGLRMNRIGHIFISHLHGDHYLGLLPLLDSYNLSGRTKDLHIYAPAPLESLLELHQQISGNYERSFALIFHATQAEKPVCILETKNLIVETLLLEHRVACTGFVFRQKTGARKMKKNKIEEYDIPYQKIPAIKQGADFVTASGQIVPNLELTTEPLTTYSYAYCSDTAYTENILPQIENVDILYHETTYLDDMTGMAAERGHATTTEAATIAKKANAKMLLIGHFSSRYRNLKPFLEEAKSVFENSFLAEEGKTFLPNET